MLVSSATVPPYIGKLISHWAGKQRIAGTGFLVHESGLIATCAHVLKKGANGELPPDKGDEYQFQFFDSGRVLNARVINFDETHDVALLQSRESVAGIRIPILVHSHTVHAHAAFSSTGYGVVNDPGAVIDYVSAIGRIVGPFAQRNVDYLQVESRQILQGMSGAPAIIGEFQVVGLISRRYQIDPSRETFFADTAFLARIEWLGHLDGRLLTDPSFSPEDPQLAALNALPDQARLASQQVIKHVHTELVQAVAWEPKSLFVVSAGRDKALHLWPASPGHQCLTTRKEENHLQAVLALAWSPDGKWLASTGADGTARIWNAQWNVQSWRRPLKYFGHAQDGGGFVHAVAWSSDSLRVVSGGNDKSVQIWEVGKGRLIKKIQATERVRAVAWNPNAEQVAFATSNQITIYKLKAGTEHPISPYDSGNVNALAWSPDGQWLAVGHESGNAHVWDPEQGNEPIATFSEHGSLPVRCLAWSPDSQLLASGGADHRVYVWIPETGAECYSYSGHEEVVNAVAWSFKASDGRQCIASAGGREVHVWQIESGPLEAH